LSAAAASEHAQALFAAWQAHQAIPALPEGLDADSAREIQARLHVLFLAAGREPLGWKIGLSAPAAMAMFGTDEPMVGVLYRDSQRGDGAEIDFASLVSPRIEGEMLIEIGAIPDAGAADDVLRGSIASVRPAFEIADSRIAGWARTIGSAIADNACCGLIVMPDRGIAAGDVDFRDAAMELLQDDALVMQGLASDCMGGIVEVYRWFLTDSRRRGRDVRPGDVVLCGAMGKPLPMESGRTYQLKLTGVGTVRCSTGVPSDA
jgi:2-keto-4-pentenoate hydratase